MTKNNISYVLCSLLLGAAICQAGFLPPVNYPIDTNPNGIVTGDFNQDGNLDLVVTGCGDIDCNISAAAFVLLGQGNGMFTVDGLFLAGPSGGTAEAAARTEEHTPARQ